MQLENVIISAILNNCQKSNSKYHNNILWWGFIGDFSLDTPQYFSNNFLTKTVIPILVLFASVLVVNVSE